MDLGSYSNCRRNATEPRLNTASENVERLRTLNRDIEESLALGRAEIYNCMTDLKNSSHSAKRRATTRPSRNNVRHYPKVSCFDTCFKTNNPNCLMPGKIGSRHKVLKPRESRAGKVLNDIRNVPKEKVETVKFVPCSVKHTVSSKSTTLQQNYRKTVKCETVTDSNTNVLNMNAPEEIPSPGTRPILLEFCDSESSDTTTSEYQPSKRQKISQCKDLPQTEPGISDEFERLQDSGNERLSSKRRRPDYFESFEAKEPDLWSTRGAPLLGYDWIAGCLDNKRSSVLTKPDEYFQDLKSFKDAYSKNAIQVKKDQSTTSEDRNLSYGSQCVHKYRVQSKLQETEQDIAVNQACSICQRLKIQVAELPKYISVPISKTKAIKKISPVSEIPVKNSLALVQNCSKKKFKRSSTNRANIF